MVTQDCPFRLEQRRITKSDLENRLKQINKEYEGEYVLGARGSNPRVYELQERLEEGGISVVFKAGEAREVYYLMNGFLEARRHD